MTGVRAPLGSLDRPFIVAHRGASEEAPENTLPAFELAVEGGAEVVECDVHLSRDGVVTVIHDADLARTTDRRGVVAELTWRDLQGADAGYPTRHGERYRGTRVPRLEEVLDLARGRCQVMIEIKADAVGPAAGGIEERCLAAVERCAMTADVAIISMAPVAVARARRIASDAVTGLVFRRRRVRRLVAETRAAGASLLIHATSTLLARPDIVAEAAGEGIRTGAYVANDEATLNGLLQIGVLSLASDRPGPMIAALDRRGVATDSTSGHP